MNRAKSNNKALVPRRRPKPVQRYPPQIDVPIVLGKTYRFQSSAAITGRNLIFTEILDLLCMAATATSAYRIVGSVKLKKIEIWATSPTLDSPVTVSFQKLSSTAGTGADSIVKSDTSMGYDRPAHLVVKFRENEQVAQWQNQNQTALYGSITVPKGAIVDLTYAFAVQESLVATAVTGAVAGATVGAVYLRALDNSQATPQLIPVSYNTI